MKAEPGEEEYCAGRGQWSWEEWGLVVGITVRKRDGSQQEN